MTVQGDFVQKYGSWAVVTGASDGIGREFARSLAACGFNLVINARRKQELESLAAELRAGHRVEVQIVDGDLTIDGVAENLFNKTQGLDIGLLVAAAGFGTSGVFLGNKIADEINMVMVNCIAVTELVFRYGQLFKNQKRGGVVVLSSLVAFQGVPYAANYAATKAYIQTFAEGLYHELKPFGVDVLSVAPGPVKTGFGARAHMAMGMAETPAVVARQSLKALGKKITIRPGFLANFLGLSLRMLPRWGRVLVMGKIMQEMTETYRISK